MAQLMAVESVETLPQIIDAARTALGVARTSAELLEARNMASVAYDAASRFTRRKAAFDHMTALAMRMQAQALRIEARAKERLADEYDAAQERREVGQSGVRTDLVVSRNEVPAPAADVGLRRDQIHEARRIRDAERADPGAIDRAIDARMAQGEAPTRAALKRDLGIAPQRKEPAAAEIVQRAVPILLDRLTSNPLAAFQSREDEAFPHTVAFLRQLPDANLAALRRAARSLALLLEEVDNDQAE